MPRQCVFCNASGTTKEHIWPNWAARYMADEAPVRHHLNVVQEGETDADRSWPQKQFTLMIGAVCGNCNNGWMAALEGRVKPFFEAALDGQGSVLNTELQKDLAAWALKTAMMVERQQKPAQPGILSEEYPYLFTHGEPSPRVRIWMASYAGTISTAVGHMYALDATVGQETLQHGDIWEVRSCSDPSCLTCWAHNIPRPTLG